MAHEDARRKVVACWRRGTETAHDGIELSSMSTSMEILPSSNIHGLAVPIMGTRQPTG